MRHTARQALWVAGCVAVGGLAADTAVADEQLLAYGKHLSQECMTCHRRDGGGRNIPTIFGLEVDYFVTTMKFYQTGARDNPAMVSVAQALNEEQLKALGVYLGTLKPAPKAAPKRQK